MEIAAQKNKRKRFFSHDLPCGAVGYARAFSSFTLVPADSTPYHALLIASPDIQL